MIDLVSTRPITAAIVAQLVTALSPIPVVDAADESTAEKLRKATEAVFVIYAGDVWNDREGSAQSGQMSWNILILARSMRGPRASGSRVGTGSLDLAESATEALVDFDPVDGSGAHSMWVNAREPYVTEDEAQDAVLCRFTHEISLEVV